ncbi:MAG TPA: ATP-binding protein [Kofleriaceae bacterium]|nr:ATP-binding protein [Kofleriaceae bacterium]
MLAAARAEDCLAGGGEMGAFMRGFDWSRHPLGPVSRWPQSLRTAVSMMLESRFAMVVAWGRDFRFFYNDRYRPVLGASKHPRALGAPAREIFPEVWHAIGPEFERTLRGEAFAMDDWLLPLDRNGYVENCWFTVSYSPIRDESGGVGGMLAVVAETTGRVESERRLTTLRELSRGAAGAQSSEDACARAVEIVAREPLDVPFAQLYLLDDDGRCARLAAHAGAIPDAARPPVIEIDDERAWPLGSVARTRETAVVDDLARRFGAMPGAPCPEPAHTAVVIPLARPGLEHPYGFLIAGVCPRRALDDRYREFFELAADHIATSVGNARALETERRRAEALAELDRAKTAFFGNVSHELRTPLTLMLGPLEDLLGDPSATLGAGERAHLEVVMRNARRLLKLVGGLLDFSRIEAGRADAGYEPVDLAAITSEIAGQFRAAIEHAGLRFTVTCDPIAAPVYVDREMWEKIVLNLLSNAFKFTFEGSIDVRLRDAGDHAILTIEDTGTGIPADELPKLFERFHRVRDARARTHEGTGIGLALVQALAHLHGGGVRVESAIDRGSAFTVAIRTGRAHLPADRLRERPRDPAAIARAFVDEAAGWAARSHAAAPPAPAARVLIADDNADMRDYLARTLSARYAVTAVADGASALEHARAHAPELILTDVMMPGLDGFELLRELRADPRTRELPVIMLSARAGEEASVEGLRASADDYLVKPFSARELIARVDSQLAVARARREAALQREHLHALFMQAPAPICILRGRDFVVELANPRCCALWSRSAEEVIGRPLLDAMPELEGQGLDQLLAGVMDTGVPYLGKERAVRIAAGGEERSRLLDFEYAPLRAPDGTIDGVLVLATDVTDAVQAREALERTVRYNEMFTAMLGHDLRNPLGAISTGAQLLVRRTDDERIVTPANRILSSSERMARMIDQLLDFTVARLGRGLELHRERVDLSAVARQVIGELEAVYASRSIELSIAGDPAGAWDADRLSQSLSNLLGNALEHGALGAPIQLELDGRAPDTLTVRVKNGGAIPPELLPVVFEPFRGSRRAERRSRGLGLGLYITREIARAHGGRLDVASTIETGTCFELELPRAGS